MVVGGRALIICPFLTERRWQQQHAFHVPWLQFYGVVQEIVLASALWMWCSGVEVSADLTS